MITITLICDRCSETATSISTATTIEETSGSCKEVIWIIKIGKFLERVKWLILSGPYHHLVRGESLLLCSECADKISSLENECEKEKSIKITYFLTHKEA